MANFKTSLTKGHFMSSMSRGAVCAVEVAPDFSKASLWKKLRQGTMTWNQHKSLPPHPGCTVWGLRSHHLTAHTRFVRTNPWNCAVNRASPTCIWKSITGVYLDCAVSCSLSLLVTNEIIVQIRLRYIRDAESITWLLTYGTPRSFLLLRFWFTFCWAT